MIFANVLLRIKITTKYPFPGLVKTIFFYFFLTKKQTKINNKMYNNKKIIFDFIKKNIIKKIKKIDIKSSY